MFKPGVESVNEALFFRPRDKIKNSTGLIEPWPAESMEMAADDTLTVKLIYSSFFVLHTYSIIILAYSASRLPLKYV